ncbi:ATP-dependent helicase HepA [compost metagenome]
MLAGIADDVKDTWITVLESFIVFLGVTFLLIWWMLTDALRGITKGLKRVFRDPMTLQNMAQLREPNEKVPLAEQMAFSEGQSIVVEKGFAGHETLSSDSEPLQMQVFLQDPDLKKGLTVKVVEAEMHEALDFKCEHCNTSVSSSSSCAHQWAAFILLWQALPFEDHEALTPKQYRLSTDLKRRLYLSRGRQPLVRASFENCELESVSLFLEDQALLGGPTLGSLLETGFGQYRLQDVSKEKETLAPRLWNMPEVFRRKITAYSQFYFNEVNEQNRLAGMLRYNFSNGMQISAKEILRHPLQKNVPADLLPQVKGHSSVFDQWPLTQQKEHLFVSQNLKELEEIMQVLLGAVAAKTRQGQLKLFIQAKSNPLKALPIQQVEFDVTSEFDWRVEFSEKKNLESDFKLISSRKKDFYFFDSFALEPETGILLVHPWLQEWSQLTEVLMDLPAHSVDTNMSEGKMPVLRLEGEFETKILLKHLRSRSIPVRITEGSQTLFSSQSQTDIYLSEEGFFYLQHSARVGGKQDLARKGWTSRSVVYLRALSEGLSFLMNSEPRDAAARSRSKRDWDLKLLKHLGVLQYLLLETLSVHFEGTLTDGRVVEKTDVFSLLQERIQSLLVSGTGVVLVRDMTLPELCSASVLSRFEDFVARTFAVLGTSESFYSEQGEVILQGVVEREFRVIYELLKRTAVTSGGDAFRKSRTSLLSKIWTGDPTKDSYLNSGSFHLPRNRKDTSLVHETLEVFQSLIPHGFKIYFRNQPLEELNDDDFKVDFNLQSDAINRDFKWFELNPRFFLMGQEIDPQAMGNFGSGGVIEHEGKMYLVPKKQMPSLRRLENFWLKLQKGKQESSQKFGGEKIYQLPRHQVLELLALRSSGYGIRGDEEWKKLCDFYDQLGSKTRELSLPSTVKAELKPYQALGVQWLQDLYNLRLGALLADDMGLGKTLQTLSFLEDLRSKKELGQVLIVVPSSLIYNWQSEVDKFTPQLPLTVFSNKDRDAIGKRLEAKEEIVVITTYGLLMEHEQFLVQYNWKVLIFDEAQNLKNITTKRTSAARSLQAGFKICLTGTPMENHYGEFYSLVDLLVPGSLGKMDEFRSKFVNTELVSPESIEDLKLKIRPLLLRRTKKEILDQLPEKQETKVSIAFEDRQKEIYRDIALAYNQQVKDTIIAQGESRVQLQMLTALLRLRQACSDPGALPNIRYDKVPPKLEALMDSVQEIVESGESALVFTQFIQTLEHTAKILKAAQIPVFVLHGGVPSKQRQKILGDFNNTPGGAVLIMTLKTGGVGLNLTKASYVFHLEPWWNPSVENQATDRAHRLGQSKAVQVFRYIMHESLEEKIELLKQRKDLKFQSLFSNTEKDLEIGPGSGTLSKADFDLLLGIKE